ncbi:uncharacterized protein LOC133355609 [Lethenteron reissneri]|uniref:uncharacterized protein LOC133355609 n=1 Tax=Lethenteron reissneri TaxID=7753 RepID=UPI002AB7B6CE|nr:uncharacterized protein LOC133355609 [Lethenteron reissneri]
MDPVAFSAYTEFYTHAHSVCHHLRAQAWRDDAESLLSVLARGSSRFSRQLRRSAELGESILTSQGEFARAQHRAARSGESLRRALAQSQKGVRVAFSELRGSALESRALFAESLRRLSALHALLAGDLGGLHAALLYALCCPLAWILTTATSTARARPWLFVLLTAQLLLERGVTTLITWGAPAGPNVQDEVWLFSWWSRRVALLVALLLLLFAHHSFRDLPALNHRLLVTLVAQQRQLTRHLLVARQKPPGKGDADAGTPATELSILSGAPDVEGERGSGGMQLSIRRDSSLQLWSPARGPRPFRSPGGVRREVQVERRGLHDSIFIANISSSVLRCRLRERGPGSPPSPCMPHHDAQRRVRRGVSPDGAFPRRVQDMEPPARASSGGAFTRSRLQDQSSGRVQDQSSGSVQGRSSGRVQDQASGRVQDKSPGRVQDQTSGRVQDQSSGRVQDKSPGRVQDRSSGRVQDKSPGRVQGRSSGRVQDKSPGRVQGRSSGRVQDKSPGRVQGRSSGRVQDKSSERVQDKSPGRVQDKSPGRVQGRSSGRVQDKSPGRVRGRSPGRVQGRASKGEQS